MPGLREILPAPARIFAVGDIHGCAAETERLLRYLLETLAPTPQDLFLFIGDYIDRGDASAQVIEMLVQFKARFPQSVFLRGNHEDMLLDFLGFKGSRGQVYVANGGDKLFSSYGIPPPYSAETIAAGVPRPHIEFLLQLEDYVLAGNYLFAHAGINPLRDIYSQRPADLFWIRDEFIQNVHYLEKTVVFGHTPYQDVMFHLPYKIGIDTGAVYGNKLTCLELPAMTLHQVNSGKEEITSIPFDEYKRRRK